MNEISDEPLVLVVDDDNDFREDIIPRALARLNARIPGTASPTPARPGPGFSLPPAALERRPPHSV